MTDTPGDQSAPTLADLMADSGDPTDVADVVRFWLATKTWDESFEVLAAGQEVLVSQSGLDTLMRSGDEADRSVHSAILQAVAGGFDIEFVQLLVTNRDAAREIAIQALRNGHDPVIRVVLALNTALGASDEGAALFLASGLAAGNLDDLLVTCQSAAATDPDGAQRVATRLEELAAQGLTNSDEVRPLLGALRRQ